MTKKLEKWANEIAVEIKELLGSTQYNNGGLYLRIKDISVDHEFSYRLSNGGLFKRLSIDLNIGGSVVTTELSLKCEYCEDSFDGDSLFRIVSVTSLSVWFAF